MQEVNLLLEALLILSMLVITVLVVTMFVQVRRQDRTDRVHERLYNIAQEKIINFEKYSGFKQEQIDVLKKRILIEFGKDLNDIQVLNILITWRNTFEQIGKEMEFVGQYINEHNW